MKYDFDTVTDRMGTSSVKWMGGKDILPMWVADMDFKAAPEIVEAVVKRAEHGVFGYTMIEDDWKNAIVGWWKRRYGFTIEPDWLTFCTGVIPIISCAIRILTSKGDNITVLSPVYDHFYIPVENNDRVILESRMTYDGNKYSIDFEDLEEKLSRSKAIILSNPHNPTGNLWSRDELNKIGELCKKNNIPVISDEIHCDITDPDKRYIPFMAASDAPCIMCVAPTKSFNIAGLHTAAAVVSDPDLRSTLRKEMNIADVTGANVFAGIACIAAYTKGEAWLDSLLEYIYDNKQTVYEYLAENIPDVRAVQGESTYLLWIDCHKITEDSAILADFIKKKSGLWLAAGSRYRGDGQYFLRMNIACPRTMLLEGLDRLKRALDEL